MEMFIVTMVLSGVLWAIYMILDASAKPELPPNVDPDTLPPDEQDFYIIESYTKSSTAVSAGICFVFTFPAVGFLVIGC